MNFLEYEVVGSSASVPHGTVMQLTADQRRRRKHVLGKDDDGNDVALQSANFKVGETVLVSKPLPRSHLWLLKTEIAESESSEEAEEEFNPLDPFEEAGDGDQEGEGSEDTEEDQPVERPLLDRHIDELRHLASELGLNPHHNAGKQKLIEMIEAAELEG